MTQNPNHSFVSTVTPRMAGYFVIGLMNVVLTVLLLAQGKTAGLVTLLAAIAMFGLFAVLRRSRIRMLNANRPTWHG